MYCLHSGLEHVSCIPQPQTVYVHRQGLQSMSHKRQKNLSVVTVLVKSCQRMRRHEEGAGILENKSHSFSSEDWFL